MTSDEQRAAFRKWWPTQPHSKLRYGSGDYEYIAEKAWQACAAQQAPQARAAIDEPRAIKDAIHFANRLDDADRKGLAPPQNWTTVSSGHIRLLAALAANPQQSNEKEQT